MLVWRDDEAQLWRRRRRSTRDDLAVEFCEEEEEEDRITNNPRFKKEHKQLLKRLSPIGVGK